MFFNLWALELGERRWWVILFDKFGLLAIVMINMMEMDRRCVVFEPVDIANKNGIEAHDIVQ